MKKFVFLLFGLLLISTGCNKKTDIVSVLKKKIEKANSYSTTGILEIVNNENIYKYDIDVSYKKSDNFRVKLKNKTNEHEQIILKNDSGVYVLTPSLNKSFKFQSEWPYNNSQSYLLQNVLNDILNDKDKQIQKGKDNNYVITTKVNYTNNKELQKQKVYVDSKGNIKRVEVLNNKNIIKMKMIYNKIKYNVNLKDDMFDLDNNMKDTKTSISMKEIDDVIYPMYMPKNTYLANEENVSLEEGERIILTFEGDTPFTLIEETASTNNELEQVYGEIELLTDVFGYINDGIASWVSNGIEYYAISEVMKQDELLKVVNSISTIPVGK